MKHNYDVTMADLTIRNIPDDLLAKIRVLSAVERRSLKSELLIIIERGAEAELSRRVDFATPPPAATQIAIWEGLAGRWDDPRSAEAIVEDLRRHRTMGRPVDL